MGTYVDTSILAAYYVPEELSEIAESVLRSSEDLLVSWLTEVELASAVSRRVRANELSAVDGESILARLSVHLEAGLYNRLPLGHVHYERARGILTGFDLALRTLDALHLAIAAQADATLLTADRALARAAESIGCSVMVLEP